MNGTAEPVKTTKRVRLYFKVGDKDGYANPLKRNLALRDGMLIDAMWEGYNLTPEAAVRDKIAYAITEYEVPVAEWNVHEAFLRDAVGPNEVYKVGGDPNVLQWRARKRLVTLSQVELGLLQPGIEARWRKHDESVEPVQVGDYTKLLPLIKSSDTLNVVALDVNQVAQGTFTVGPAVGDDYATFALAYADIANLTGMLTFTQSGEITQVAIPIITENLGGNTFNTTSDDWHHTNNTRGHLLNAAQAGQIFSLQAEGPGTINMCSLRCERSVAGANVNSSFIRIVNTVVGYTLHIYDNIYNGANLVGRGIGVGVNTVTVNTFDNMICGCGAGSDGIGTDGAANANNIVANNVVYSCGGDGIDANGAAGIYRRNACYDNGTDFANIGAATGDRNQSQDLTAANGNWLAGTLNQTGGNPAADFDSVDDQHPKFLRPTYGGVLQLAGGGVYLAANTTDAAGRPWTVYGDWIGAKAHPGPVAEPDLTDWTLYVNNSQYAIAFRKHLEGTHADGVRFPLVINQNELPAASEAHIFANARPDGSDLIVVTADGTELPTECVDFNAGAGTFTLWAQYDAIDDEYGDAAFDPVFMVQYGGTGPTGATNLVYRNNYAVAADHAPWYHMESEAGDEPDAAGYYDGTVPAMQARGAAAQVRNGMDLEAGNAADEITNAAAGNFTVLDRWSCVCWVKREQIGINAPLFARIQPGGDIRGWLCRFVAGNNIAWFLREQAGQNDNYTAPANASTAWQMIVFTKANHVGDDAYHIYVNGQDQPLTAATNTLGNGDDITNQEPFEVGARATLGRWYDGMMDEVRVWYGEMTQAVIRTHMNNEYSVADNGVWDWGENIGENPGAPSGAGRQRQYVYRMLHSGTRV